MIKLNGICKRYNSNAIFENLSYEFKDNGFYFLLGESGSGKTTLLNLIGNLETCTEGNIEKNTDICYVFQEANLLTDFTVYENIKITGLEDEQIDIILESLQILDLKHKAVHILSGGEQQRVAIGRALAMSGQILLLDEPTGHLDEQNTIQILNILKKLSQTRLVIMTTHDTSLALKYADVILEIKNRTLLETIQNTLKENEGKLQQNNLKKKFFNFKYQFLYAMKLIKARPLKYVITVFLSMLSLLLSFLILNVIFFNATDVIQTAVLKDNRHLYSIKKEYFNEPTNEFLDFTYGLKLEEELALVQPGETCSYYKTITFPSVKYDTSTKFQLIIQNLDYKGIHITDFVSNYLFASQKCIGEKIDIKLDNSIFQLEITGIKDTNYGKVYDQYFSNEEYMNHHKDDFLFHYGVVYISATTYKKIISSQPVHLIGTNFTLNNLDLRTYMSTYYAMSFESNHNLSGNQMLVSRAFYNTYMMNKVFPVTYQVRNIENTMNENLYINKLNFYTILKDVYIVDIDETLDSDVSVSKKIFDKLIEEYFHYAIDGICLDDTLKIRTLHQNGFKIANEDIGKTYALNEVLNKVLKLFISGVCFIVVTISILALYFSIAGFMDKKSKELFIMKSIGIPKKRILNVFIIYIVFVILIGLIFALVFGNLCIILFDEFLKNEVFYIFYNIFIFQFKPYLALLCLVFLTSLLILLNPMISLKKIDIATLVKLNN